MARIRYAVDDWFACAWYRAHVPGMALKGVGHEVVLDKRLAPKDAEDCDVLVCQRQWRREAVEAVKAAKKRGVTVVYELDDDVWHLPPTNPGYKGWSRPEVLGAAEYCIRTADVVTTTTESLAETLRRLNRNVRVLPNMLPRDHWPAELPDRSDRQVTSVGWAGSTGRLPDLREILGVVERLLDQCGPSVQFMIAGTYQPGERAPDRVVAIPPTTIERYPHDVLARFDIGLAPIVANKFNESKSDLKFIEYGWMGIATVASKVGPYEAGIVHGETGLLARNPKDWLKHLRRLVEDVDLRDHIAKNARRVAEGRVMEDHVGLWERAYGITRPSE